MLLRNKIPKRVSAYDAICKLASGSNIYVHSTSMAPTVLLKALCERVTSNKDSINLYHLHLDGEVPCVHPPYSDRITSNSFFVGASVRSAVNAGRATYVPAHLSTVPRLLRDRTIPIDATLVQTSYPDDNGNCSLGTSVEATLAAMESSQTIVCQMNVNVPRTYGDAQVPLTCFDYIVEHQSPMHALVPRAPNDAERTIGKLIADNLIKDGDTLQVGIGSIPDMVLASLHQHRDLGVHSEMISNGCVSLLQKGVINNSRKTLDPGKTVLSFAIGCHKLYDFMDDNAGIVMRDLEYVNDPRVICQQDNLISINSAIEVSLTGQVCADSIGPRLYSGVGGQCDFVLGASLSKGGKAIIALTSQSPKGHSRIVPFIKQGGGVVTTRAHVNYVVTEYGVVSLRGKSLQERCKKLISIAHPGDRDNLTGYARANGLLSQ